MKQSKRISFTIIFMLLLLNISTPVYAVNTKPTAEQKAAAEERKFEPVESNEWHGWP